MTIRNPDDLPSNREIESFLAKVSPEPNSGCHFWLGHVNPVGYGSLEFRGSRVRAHRFSFAIHLGRWPSGQVLHRCDVPCCVNPEHLFEGNAQTNLSDMALKGRGERDHSLPYGVQAYKDVSYRARVSFKGVLYHLGTYRSVSEAAEAAYEARRRFHSSILEESCP